MEKLSLSATLRNLEDKVSDLRTKKLVPAVVYGHSVDPIHISVPTSDFLRTFRKGGQTHIIELAIEGKKYSVLAHDVQKHPVTGDFLHIDFFAVSAKEKVHVTVPLHLVGKSQASVEGCVIEQYLHSVEIKALPADLIDSIEADIVALVKEGDVIHLSDVVSAPAYSKIEVLTPLTEGVAAAHLPKEVQEEVGAPEAIVEAEAVAQKTEDTSSEAAA